MGRLAQPLEPGRRLSRPEQGAGRSGAGMVDEIRSQQVEQTRRCDQVSSSRLLDSRCLTAFTRK